MDSFSKEYIRNVKLIWNEDGVYYYPNSVGKGIWQCVITTDLNNHIFSIPKLSNFKTNVWLLNKNFDEITEQDFVDAQFFRVVDDIDELKRDEQFEKCHFKNDINWVIKYFKLETSKGHFYVALTFSDSRKSIQDLEYRVEPI